MKKILLISLILASATGLAACGRKGDLNPPPSQSSQE